MKTTTLVLILSLTSLSLRAQVPPRMPARVSGRAVAPRASPAPPPRSRRLKQPRRRISPGRAGRHAAASTSPIINTEASANGNGALNNGSQHGATRAI